MSELDEEAGAGGPSGRGPAPRRVARKRETILVTGISGRLGKLAARRLHREWGIVGIDRRPFPGAPKDVQVHQLDLRRKKCEDVFRNVRPSAVVHLGVMHDPRRGQEEHYSFNIGGTSRILEYCTRYGVPKLVFLSSANVYGPRPSNDNFLTEDAPLMGSETFSEIRDLIGLDRLVQSFFWKHPHIETCILRPVHIVGPNVRNAPSNYLRKKVVPVLAGYDPMVQIIHEEDVVEALACALRPGVRGIFNVVGPGEVPLSVILEQLGRTPLPVPHPVLERALRTMFRWRMTTFPAPEIDHIKYLCTVDGSRARELLGFTPRFSLRDTIESVRRAPAVG